MKKIRIGNDFVFAWEIERNGLPEDLSSVLEKHLHLSVFGKRVELVEGVDYDIIGNVIRIEVTPVIASIIGTYKAEFHYILPDNGLIDEDRKCAVDVDAFQIVARTAQADDSTEFSMTSDMAIALKGEKGEKGIGVPIGGTTGQQLIKKSNVDYDFEWQTPAGAGAGAGAGDMLKSEYDSDDNGIVDNAEKVNGFTVETNVPANAKFTDTVYTHPETHPASIILQDASNRFVSDAEKLAWNDKVDNSRVLTDVPANAKFTDTVYSHPASHPYSMITGAPTSLPANGGDSATVNGKTVEENVPAGAKFTDTIYVHPTSDGNLHVPITGTTNNGKVLKAGATAGSLAWGTDNDTITTINGKTGTITKADIVALGIPAQDTVYTHPTGTNPHGTTKDDVGLGNVDNTSDVNKPVSTAQASAIDAKYTKPALGIPKTDLVTDVQTSLGKADTALQSFTETDPTVPSWAKQTNKPDYTATEVGAIPASQKGANNGVAELDSSGKVLSSQLPSYVDDVLEYATSTNFPTTGEAGKIYIAINTNLTYRWTGSAYTEISPSIALGETSATAYRGDRGKTAYDHSQTAHAPSTAQKNSDITKAEIEAKLTGAITTHSHTVTKANVGLGSVDNTSDANKPVSTAQAAAIALKIDASKFQVVTELPASPVSGTFYFVKE